ncbi:MAG: CoA pyrophosphatase [Alphaproteobacteria bacterium]|jgi:8-oxo-dGTP pyrophosphatase MutT (NUDIX family)|nr:CoA pyrophosphatase [Rhodospirillaceae bacterium]MDG2482436.1 CoA pyrophosphatase [Alphaproteobacteria bacterium]MBT6202927.1 CoA pyrophosphatase [Rhodospirillaceae bacterium]MBT6509278.1 CoA pyrophosphatase [Rhodospirillaceae bacterium]MBT7614969.1 CoA pyrophosphatase [Rhodospirillaceae bacterium]
MTRDEVLNALRTMAPPVMAAPPSDWEDDPPERRAAVLIPLVDYDEGLTVVFGQRSKALRTHAGEVSFPGGRIEAGEGEVEAALREAEEEVGLDPARVRILARLNTHRAGSGFTMAPHVGLVTPPIDLVPDGTEIEDVFEVPLSFLLDPVNHRRESMYWRGADRWYSVFEYGPRYIWGATATVMVNLLQVLRREV